MNNNNREKNEKTIAIGLSLIIICISLLVGTLLFFKLNTLFNSYMESQCARQGKITADAVSQGFRLESEWLDYFAKQVEYGNLSVTDLPELISGGEAGVYVGIIGIDGELIAGDKIDVSKFGSLRATIKGYDTVDYVAGEGLILSCPILHKGNVRYVLYELYDNDAAAYNFSFDTYENYSFCCVTSHESEHVFSLQNVDESWIELMENSKIEDAFNNMARELSVTGFAARSVNIGYGKDFFVYKAEIPDTSLVLFGIVEKKVVNSGIPDIYGLIFWICGILLITLAAAMIYLTKASAKVRSFWGMTKYFVIFLLKHDAHGA